MPTDPDVTDHLELLLHKPQPRLRPALLAGAGLAVLVAVVGLTDRVIARQNLNVWTQQQAIPTVAVISPWTDTNGQSLVLPGDVEAFYNAQIHARVSGYLKDWYDDIGAHVKAGQVLAVIDTPDLDQQLAQARADLATAVANQKLAQLTADRWTNLLARDAVSRQETDEKTGDLAAKNALVNAAGANLQRLEALEAFKRITAPFDGVVTARTTDKGQLIAAGTPNDPGLFTVSDTHRLRVYVHVPQSYSAELKAGDVANLTVPEYPGQTFQATLVSTSGAVNDQSGALLVELQLDNAAGLLKPGDYAQVRFQLPVSANQLTVPASALMFRQTGMAVATVGPGSRVVMKPITIGTDLGTAVEVATGIGPTDRIIDNPPDSLANGDLVRVSGPVRPYAGAARPS